MSGFIQVGDVIGKDRFFISVPETDVAKASGLMGDKHTFVTIEQDHLSWLVSELAAKLPNVESIQDTFDEALIRHEEMREEE